MLNNLSINPEKKAAKIVNFIKDTFRKTGLEKGVIGVSGGIDSAVSLVLTVKAIGKGNVFPCLLPYNKSKAQSYKDGMFVLSSLSIPQKQVSVFDVKKVADCFEKYLAPMDRIRLGNIMARVRMIFLFDQAKKRKALVVGTENKTEHLLGYFTRFGDAASDLEPISNLYKTQVRELAKYLGVPEKIIEKAPSANLWGGQTDEGEFGFSYEEADAILNLFVDRKKPIAEVVNKGYPKKLVEKVINRMKQNDFKHQVPYYP